MKLSINPFYKDGVYITGYRYIENEMIKTLNNIKSNQRMEVLKYLENVIIDESYINESNHLIAFRNGIFNVKTNELLPFSPDYIITNKINWDYNSNAYYELTDEVLNKIACNDKAIRMLLEEMIGYCFYRENIIQKAFILTGAGSNGKSTLLAIINKILGDCNVSALDLKSLTDRFGKASLYKTI